MKSGTKTLKLARICAIYLAHGNSEDNSNIGILKMSKGFTTGVSAKSSTFPTPEELIEKAKSMIPVLRERAASQEQNRRVSKQTIEEFKDAGFFRVLQPKRWDGYEMDPGTFCEIEIALAEGDMSSAWVYGVMGVHNFQMGLFDDRAGKDVWGEDTSHLIASTYQPGGVATPRKGGYEFGGRWKFSSGVEHAEWLFLGGIFGGEFITCLVPREDYQIIDAWDVSGLKATGSQDIQVNNIFVPEHRVHRALDGIKCDSPGNAVNTAPLYRLPFMQVFIRGVTSSCIGGLQGMLNDFQEYGAKRVGVVSGATNQDPDATLAYAESVASIDEMKCILHRNFDSMMRYANKREPPPIDKRLLYKFQAASVPERTLQLASRIFKSTGSAGIFSTLPYGRIYNDIIAARQHAASQYQVTGRAWGATLFGEENTEWYL